MLVYYPMWLTPLFVVPSGCRFHTVVSVTPVLKVISRNNFLSPGLKSNGITDEQYMPAKHHYQMPLRQSAQFARRLLFNTDTTNHCWEVNLIFLWQFSNKSEHFFQCQGRVCFHTKTVLQPRHGKMLICKHSNKLFTMTKVFSWGWHNFTTRTGTPKCGFFYCYFIIFIFFIHVFTGCFKSSCSFFEHRKKNAFRTVRSMKPCKLMTHVHTFFTHNFSSLYVPLCFLTFFRRHGIEWASSVKVAKGTFCHAWHSCILSFPIVFGTGSRYVTCQ